MHFAHGQIMVCLMPKRNVLCIDCVKAVADPGFPVGGHGPIRAGMDLLCGHFSPKMYAKTKELGPVGGGGRAR